MKLIGITGPSGSGKSILSDHWRKAGYACLDADRIYHEMLLPPSPCVSAIANVFGSELLLPDGTLDRKALAEKVFDDSTALQKLNETVLPLVIEEIKNRINLLCLRGEKVVVLDAPTLIESGFHRFCDVVITVIAPEEERLVRIMERDSLDRASATHRISAQQKEEFYIGESDLVIYNDRSPEELCRAGDTVLHEVLVL